MPQLTGAARAAPGRVRRPRPGPRATAHQVSLLKILLSGKKEWEKTFDAILDPIMVLDGDGRVIRANLQLARALGRTHRRSSTAQPYAELLGAAGRGTGDRFPAEPVDPIAESLADGRPRHVETRYARLPGLHEVTISPLGDGARRQGSWSSSRT